MTIQQLREKFPHTERTIYLDHAATGPLSEPVRKAIEGVVEERHRGEINNYEEAVPRVQQTRERIATILGTSAERIALVPNTSSALNILALGIPWQEGDRVAVPACEFPANVYPFLNLQRRGVAVDFIPHGEGTLSLDDIERALQPSTRLLSLSWVQFLSGFRIDLAAVADLCRARGVLCSVDAIQGVGAVQVDVEAAGVDFVASGAHKWMMGTQGLGFMYLTKSLQDRLDPPMAGWLHGPVDWEQLFEYELSFHEDASRFHLGTMNHLGVSALHAALELYLDAGPEWCERRVLARSRQLREGLRDCGIEQYGTAHVQHASGIVTVDYREAEALHSFLADHSVAVALRNGKLRFSPTYYNSAEEIDHVLNLVEHFESKRTVTE